MTADVEPTIKNVRLTLTVPAGTVTLTITRTGPSGTPAHPRGWASATVIPGPVVARDYEAPIGVPLSYRAESFNAAGASLDVQIVAITVPAGTCDMWLTDLARAGNTQQVIIESLPELSYPVDATVHDVLSRRAPIVTSDIAHTPAFELSFLTETDNERNAARFTLGNGIPVLLRTPPEDGIGNFYFSVLEYVEQRIVQPAGVPDRRFVVRGRQVDRPDPILYSPTPPQTYATIKSRFATYGDVKAHYATYDAMAYDWTGLAASDVFPWPPTDV